MSSKAKFVDHAIDRYFERTDTDIGLKEIAKAIENNNLMYVKRLSPTRSLTYVKVYRPRLDTEIFKIVLIRKSKKIITILPWKSLFHICYVIEMEKYSKKFTVDLYPDCYLETNKPHALTQICEHTFNPEPYALQLNYNHPLFEIIFNAAWKTFEGFDNAHKTFCEEREKGNETFKVEDEYENKVRYIHYRSED